MDGSHGYSGTPLDRKLGLKAGMRVWTLHAPEAYTEWLERASRTVGATPPGDGQTGRVDFIHFFARDQKTLDAAFAEARSRLEEDGLVWASWPKRSSGLPSGIGRSEVMASGKKVGLVDVKVCAVDETWSGLKFVIPVKDRR